MPERSKGWWCGKCESRAPGWAGEPCSLPPSKLLLLGWAQGLWEPAPSLCPGAAPFTSLSRN